jgi:hypothetical protein
MAIMTLSKCKTMSELFALIAAPLLVDFPASLLGCRVLGLIIRPGISLNGKPIEVGENKSPVTLLRKVSDKLISELETFGK